HVEAGVLRFPALLLDPLLNHLLVANDSHPGLVNFEWHAPEALSMEFAQLILIIMVIRGAQYYPAHSALSHECIFPFGRFSRRAISLIKSRKMLVQHVPNGLVLREPECVIQRANE